MERVEQGTFSVGVRMSAVPDFLEGQLKLYREQAEQAESWKTDHEEAMHCRSIEDAIQLGLAVLDNIRRRNRAWAREVENGAKVSWESSEAIAQWYRWWKERSTVLLRAIDSCEAHGYAVKEAKKFRAELRDVCLMALDTSRTKESVDSINSGRGISNTAAMSALRNHLGSKGA